MAPVDEPPAGGPPAPPVPSGPATAPGLAAADPLIGAVLADRYEIVRRIGEGGMGAVYEGRHTVLGRPVAVKVLLEKFHEKTELVARLLQEARMASAIGHENIVDVTDFGTTADGRSFVVMEFLEGESLAQLVMRDAPLAVERCLRIARQVASALSAAHEKGIVHRDVKPENVFLLRRGEQDFVKVVDFGVSKAVRSRDDGAELLRLTRTGMVLGTPLYMSPEQARGGDDVDARVDVWAVGVMLYECLTGEVPFRANNYLGVISQVLTQAVQPPSRLRPELGIPPAVEAVVLRAMEKDRDRRYQTMAELERDLDRLMAGDPNVGISASAPVLAPEPAPTTARWHLGIAAVLVVGVGLAFALARTEEERRRAPDDDPAAAAPSAAPGSDPLGAEAAGPAPTIGATAPGASGAVSGTKSAEPSGRTSGSAGGGSAARGTGVPGEPSRAGAAATGAGAGTGAEAGGAGAASARAAAPSGGAPATAGGEAPSLVGSAPDEVRAITTTARDRGPSSADPAAVRASGARPPTNGPARRRGGAPSRREDDITEAAGEPVPSAESAYGTARKRRTPPAPRSPASP